MHNNKYIVVEFPCFASWLWQNPPKWKYHKSFGGSRKR